MLTTIYIGIIILLRFVQSYYGKINTILYPDTFKNKSLAVAVSCGLSAVSAIVLWLISGASFNISVLTIFCATVSGLSLAFCKLLDVYALQKGTMVLSSAAGNAGMLVPCVIGIWLFNEPIKPIVWLLIAVFLVSIYLLCVSAKEQKPEFSVKVIFVLVFSFIFNGLTMICQKIVAVYAPDDDVSLFSMLTFLIPSIIFFVIYLFSKDILDNEGNKEKINKKLWIIILILAVAVFIINQLATICGKTMDSAILFTLINGSSLIISALISATCFKEKINAKTVTGLFLCLASLILIKFLS